MKTSKLVALGLLIALLCTASTRAQVMVDVSKITCDEFMLYKLTDPRNIAIWLSGYYNGKRDNTLIDTQVFTDNYNKLRTHCIRNPSRTVMQAVKILFGPPK